MKHNTLYIRQLYLIFIILLSVKTDLFPQGTDIGTGNQPGLFIGINVGPSQSQILNTGTLAVDKLLSAKKYTFSGSAEIGYFFTSYFGLSSGIGFASYKTQVTLDTYQSNFITVDSENESYERRVTSADISELQNVGFISIPLCLNFRIPFSNTIGFFLQPGISMSLPIIKDYKTNGTFTYKGYYPAYNVVLENLPAYGFPSNLNSDAEGELKLKPYGINVMASAGFDFFIQQKIQIAVGASYDKSLSTISEYTSIDQFQLSSEAYQINSLMGGSSKATLQSMGLKIIFRYYLR